MMAKELAEAMRRHNETLRDPIAKLKARAMSTIILEAMLHDDEEEEEPQQTTANDKKAEEEVPSTSANQEEMARLAAQHETILRRLFEKGDTLLFMPHLTESKREEATLPDTQPEDRASAFVTDEPDDEPKQQAQPSRETKDEEGRSIPIIYVRQSCLDAKRMMSGHHHHCQHQEAPKTCGLKSAEQLRHKILMSYIDQIAKRITDSIMDRCTSFEIRLLDLDLLPVIKETFLSNGYKCVEEERILNISW